MKSLQLGIVGCGDFLRLQKPSIDKTTAVKVAGLYDPMQERSQAYTKDWSDARIYESAEALIDDPVIDAVAIFVPPWLRKPLLVRAAQNGKHIITTKPLAPSIADCEAMVEAVDSAGVTAAVIYNRTDSALVQTLKTILESGEFGRLALYKQDWLHHYPHWNTWALDPEKNGGPFMDAMIHNLNIARYLMGREATQGTFFSDRHAHPDLPCADTESLKLDFPGNSSAHLFITWAADLHLLEEGGNYREHFDIWYAITDQGWRLTSGKTNEGTCIAASRMGENKRFPLNPADETHFEEFIGRIHGKTDCWRNLASIPEAAQDIRIIRESSARPGTRVDFS